MTEKNEDLEKLILSRVMRLNAVAHGIAGGLVLGLLIFVATNWLVLKGGDVVGPNLALLAQYFVGYSVTFAGSLIGFAYGFVTGFLAGFLVAHTYNWLAGRRERN